MRMRRRSRHLKHRYRVVVAAVLAAVGLALLFAYQRGMARPAVSPRLVPPLTVARVVEWEERTWTEGSAPHVSARYTQAIRSDGSSMAGKTIYSASGQVLESTREVYLISGLHAVIADDLEAVTAMQNVTAKADLSRRLRDWDPATRCAVTFDRSASRSIVAGAGTEGGSVLGWRVVQAIAETALRKSTLWLAPELGCAELREVVELRAAGEAARFSERVATRAVREEPADSYFDWPSHYKNVSPSQRYLLGRERCQCPRDEKVLASLAAEDKIYAARRYTKP